MFLSLKKDPSKTCLSDGVFRLPLEMIAAGWSTSVVFPIAGS